MQHSADLLRSYHDADERYHQALRRYFAAFTQAPQSEFMPHPERLLLDAAALQQLSELGMEAENARQRWMHSLWELSGRDPDVAR
jgi:hypothetical protein